MDNLKFQSSKKVCDIKIILPISNDLKWNSTSLATLIFAHYDHVKFLNCKGEI